MIFFSNNENVRYSFVYNLYYYLYKTEENRFFKINKYIYFYFFEIFIF